MANWKLKLECLEQWMRATTGRGLERDRSKEQQHQHTTKFGKPNRTKFNKQRNG